MSVDASHGYLLIHTNSREIVPGSGIPFGEATYVEEIPSDPYGGVIAVPCQYIPDAPVSGPPEG